MKYTSFRLNFPQFQPVFSRWCASRQTNKYFFAFKTLLKILCENFTHLRLKELPLASSLSLFSNKNCAETTGVFLLLCKNSWMNEYRFKTILGVKGWNFRDDAAVALWRGSTFPLILFRQIIFEWTKKGATQITASLSLFFSKNWNNRFHKKGRRWE